LYNEQLNLSYHLNLQILSDELNFNQIDHIVIHPDNVFCLDGVRMFRAKGEIKSNYVYTITDPADHGILQVTEDTCFLAFNEGISQYCNATSSIIIITGSQDPIFIINLLQDIFDKYAKWDRALHLALHSEDPLNRMLEVSIPIFQNPLFIHDKDFFVLACPHWVEGMLKWEAEPRTGRKMVPLDLINTFRVDEEYLNSLKFKSASIFSAGIRGYQVLFSNLWHNDHYRGRICVDELVRPVEKSDIYHLDYLSSIVSSCISLQNIFWHSIGSELDSFFTDVLSGHDIDPLSLTNHLHYLNWEMDDQYLILKIVSDREDYRPITPATLFGYIESRIAECRAMLFQQDIIVIVNLSGSQTTASGVLSALAYIIRDGMFKMGVSSQINNFADLQYGYIQASLALNYGKNSNSMIWYYHFRDYALQFVIDSSCSILPSHLLISEKLQKLKEYDALNKTELYRTAEEYLKQERNAVLTAKALFIHRSTLLYRLNRIHSIADIDFDSEKERLYMLLSFQMPQADA